MNNYKYVFSHVVYFCPQRVFDRINDKYAGTKSIKHFTCWNQLLCMIFSQLSYSESLRDLIIVIEAQQSRVYY